MVILKEYSYLNTMLKEIQNKQPFGVSLIYMFGSRFSGKTINYALYIIKSLNTVQIDGQYAKVSNVVYRKELRDILETWDDYNTIAKDQLLEDDIYTSKTRMRWECANGNVCRFEYLQRKKKNKTYGKGRSQIVGDYINIIFEEATEFTPKDIKDVYNAVRGLNPKAHICFVFIANPEQPNNWLVKTCVSILPFDEEIMRLEGHQFKIWEDIGLDDKNKTKKLIHYVNWRRIQKFKTEPAPQKKLGYRYIALDPIILPQYKLDQLVESYELDELGAKVDDIGCPGADTSYIFLRHIPKLETAQYYNHSYLVGGCDPGFGKSRGSSYTGFCLVGYDAKDSIDVDVYATFKWDQRIQYADPIWILNSAIDFFIKEVNEYCQRTRSVVNADYPVIVKVDYSAIESISILNDFARQRGVSDWLKFVPCIKLNKWDQYALLNYLMSIKHLRISKMKAMPLIDELCSIQQDDNAATFKTIGPDHLIDSLCYALGNAIYKSVTPDTRAYFQSILSKKAKKVI